MEIAFVVRAWNKFPARELNVFTLQENTWDDYGYKTTFQLFRGLGNEEPANIGIVKIARRGDGNLSGRTRLPASFKTLDTRYFSLGQDREYYDNIRALDDTTRQAIFTSLGDIAFNSDLSAQVQDEPVLQTSLLRDVNESVVATQFRRIAQGKPALTHYEFTYDPPGQPGVIPPTLRFRVSADSTPPTNVHVLIGANGVGKSTLMRNFAASLVPEADHREVGSFQHTKIEDDDNKRVPFNNVVTVAFSAFDSSPPKRTRSGGKYGDIAQDVVGLGAEDLEDQFAKDLRLCTRGPRRERWLTALRYLTESDPVLRDAQMHEVLDFQVDPEEVIGAAEAFKLLSSGHKIVLLTLTAIVRFVEEHTLVLIDEPETHLHPPLLSALIRALSELVVERNGVAIIATHSPVVLQDVPRSCVQVLRRDGQQQSVSPPMIETFGESVSVLTSAVFGLDVTTTGFHTVLDRLSRSSLKGGEKLQSQLGAEGRAVLRALEDDEEDSI